MQMTPARATRLIQTATAKKWEFFEGDCDFGGLGPYLTTTDSQLFDAARFLASQKPGQAIKDIHIEEYPQPRHYAFYGKALRILADAGANFEERNRFTSGLEPGSPGE